MEKLIRNTPNNYILGYKIKKLYNNQRYLLSKDIIKIVEETPNYIKIGAKVRNLF